MPNFAEGFSNIWSNKKRFAEVNETRFEVGHQEGKEICVGKVMTEPAPAKKIRLSF